MVELRFIKCVIMIILLGKKVNSFYRRWETFKISTNVMEKGREGKEEYNCYY